MKPVQKQGNFFALGKQQRSVSLHGEIKGHKPRFDGERFVRPAVPVIFFTEGAKQRTGVDVIKRPATPVHLRCGVSISDYASSAQPLSLAMKEVNWRRKK